MQNDEAQEDNQSQSHSPEWMDRMEGNISGKNKPQEFGRQAEFIDPTLKP